MFKFFISRLIQTVIILLTLLSIMFFTLRLLPGSPFDSETAISSEVRAHLNSRYHLDQPLIDQYFLYLRSLGKGELGVSYHYQDQNVGELITEALPVTLKLGVLSLLISFLWGIPLGLIAARFHNHWQDRVAMLFAVVGESMPTFLLAPILILIFSFYLDILPPALWESPKYYILPVISLGIRPAAMIARLIRSSALDIMSSDFVRTARSKGASENRILFHHVLRNCLIPILGISGTLVAQVLSGSFVVELLFAVPGLGHYLIESVIDRDYPLVMSLSLWYAILLSTSQFIMDVLSGLVDPRVRLS